MPSPRPEDFQAGVPLSFAASHHDTLGYVGHC